MRRRLELLLLRADAVRRLGAKWVAFRCWYWFLRRSGLLERRTPTMEWSSVEVPYEPSAPPGFVDVDELSAFLRSQYDDDAIAGLLCHAERLRRREFDVFGAVVRPDDWHHEACRDVRFDRSAHWTRVRADGPTDIKLVWEPSRFGWAFDLSRLHVLRPDAGAGDLFWELLDEWMAQNPPNVGVNWECGQEASIRLMAVVAAASAMPDTWSESRAAQFGRFVAATARRVNANISYARSQQNNHHASEAVGLVTAGVVFGAEGESTAWLKAGSRHLREVCETLILPDGGSSQYSLNYHRVFLHDLVWTAQMMRSADEQPPAWLVHAGQRATRFLDALVDPISGGVPALGNDDGARLLPLAKVPHRVMSPDVALAGSCFDVAVRGGGDQIEPLAWFGLAQPSRLDPPQGVSELRSFPDMGVHVLESGRVRAIVRAVDHRFRPSHDDQLHCDIWIDGQNVVRDPGTVSYTPNRDEPGMLSASDLHNGPRKSGGRSMRRVGKFLWADWSRAWPEHLEADERAVRGVFRLVSGDDEIVREVEVTDAVRVTDRCDGVELVSTWILDGADFSTTGSVEQISTVVASNYGEFNERSALRVRGEGRVESGVVVP